MKKITLLLICLVTNLLVFGQWTDDTAMNTLIGGENPQANLSIAGNNGNTYNVFWNHLSDSTNYDLRLQILDPSGVKQFGPAGTIITSTIPMSTFTQIMSLTKDEDDNIYVGCTATNGNGGHAFKMDSEGNNLWGPDGLSLGVGYLVGVKPLSSGNVMVSWMDNDGNGNIQKFDSDANPVWTNPVGLPLYVPAYTFEMSDGGTTTIYHKRAGFGIFSVDYAQRYDSNGVPQWDEPLQLFADNYNTAYNAKYSAYQEGDVIYYSYKLAHSSRFDAFVQRINPDGTLPWGLTGVDFDVNQTNYEQEIQITSVPTSNFIWSLCRYTDSGQSQVGIYTQKFDKVTGNRLLTDNAKVVYPLINAPTINPAGTIRLYNDQLMFLTVDGSFAAGNHLYINLLDEAGDFAWPEQSIPMGTTDAVKSRIELVKTSETDFVATFLEDKGNGEHIYAQHFQYDPVGVEDIVANQNITYANPITDRLELNSDNAILSVSIYTVEGQLVYQVAKNQANNLAIDASNWTSGIYLGVIATEDGVYQSIKIVKL